jgi:hypothetical protein
MPLLREKRNTVLLTFRFDQEKHICTTLAIPNAGESADMKVITLNKLIGKRTVKCLEIPHYTYTT